MFDILYMHTLRAWKFSSAGRASALQAEGHRFEPYNFHQKRRPKGLFLLPKASRAEREVEGYKVLQNAGSYNKTKKEDRKVFFLLPKASRAERGVEGYKVLQNAGSYNKTKKEDREVFFLLPKASRAERGGGRLQGSAGCRFL